MKKTTAHKLYRTGAVVLIAAILASGTFAWRDLSQRKVNEFTGGNNPDVVLVEDFEETADWSIQNPVVNKDVSVKNTGDTELYVRVKFSEYLETKGSAYVLDENGQEVLFALDKDGNYIETTAEDPNGFAANGKYYVVAQGANGEIDAMNDTNRNGQIGKHMIDDSVVVQTAGATRGDHTTYPVHNVYTRAEGATDSFYAWIDEITWQMPNAVTMAEWQADGSKYGAFWVLDSDGWAYWAEPLRSGAQTALLMDSATMEHMVVGEMFYAVGSQLDAISPDETTAWDTTMTDAAKTFFAGLLEQPVTPAYAVGDTVEFGTHFDDKMEGEAISWWVTDVAADGTLTLLAQETVGGKVPYHEVRQVAADWENSDLRAYMNGEFFTTFFTAEEQAKILPTTVKTVVLNEEEEACGTVETTEKVFLLAAQNASGYQETYTVKDIKALDEEHGTSMTRYLNTVAAGKYSWTRSPAEKYPSKDAHAMTSEGKIAWQSNSMDAAVRPMIRVKL